MRATRRKPRKELLESERLIIRGAITNKEFTEQYISIHDPNLIASEYNRAILKWALDFFTDHGDICGVTHIADVFREKTQKMEDEEAENYEITLAVLSESSQEYDSNASYLLERATQYLNDQKITKLTKELKAIGSGGTLDDKLGVIERFEKVTGAELAGINPFTDEASVSQAFQNLQKPIITYPGKLGKLLNSQFTRDSFVAFLGREKIGKTWLLMDVMFRGLRNRRKVAFFQAGDMSQDQFIRRMGIRCARVSDMPEYLKEILVPVVDCIHNQTGDCEDRPEDNFEVVARPEEDDEGNLTGRSVFEDYYDNMDHTPCTICKNVKPLDDTPESYKLAQEERRRFEGSTWFKVRERLRSEHRLDDLKASAALRKWYNKYHHPDFRLSTHPTGTLSTDQIKKILKEWERTEGFVPDVIVIDYADILNPSDPGQSFRHQQNDIWASLRGISTEWNCNVTTATQADAQSYTKFLLDLSNFSEDKRKYSHVTAFFGMNQTLAEKPRKIIRINPLLMRESEFNSKRYVTVLQSLEQGQFYLDCF